MDIAKEDALAYEKLRQDLYTSKNPLAIPWFQLALFISMSKECQRLVGGYMKIKNSEGHSARKRACHQFQAAVLRSHYRFSSGLAGFSTMCTHALLSRRVFCCSIVGRDKGGGEFERFMFTSTEGIYMMPKQEGNESFHDNELRLGRNRYQLIKSDDLKCVPLKVGIVENYRDWLQLVNTFKASMTIKKESESFLAAAVALLMQFEGA
jgi:hypothetical protein